MTPTRSVLPALAVLIAGCQQTASPDVTRVIPAAVVTAQEGSAPGDAPGQCWVQLPPTTQTKLVEQTVRVQDAVIGPDGTQTAPAIYRKVQAPVEVETSSNRGFARLCDAQLTAPFVETLQRALSARGYYLGEIDGTLTPATNAAVRAYQLSQGLDSDMLSVAAAQQLGLVMVDLEVGAQTAQAE